MEKITELIITLLLSGTIALIVIPIAKRLAQKLNLVDQPNHRKVHAKPVPLVGGISVAIAAILALSMSPSFAKVFYVHLPFITASFLLLLIGMIDDKMDIKPSLRLIIQLACAWAVASLGIRLSSLYGIFGIYELPIFIQYLLTITIIAGVVNAFNLMDGIDGLAGGLALIGIALMIPIFYSLGHQGFALLLAAISGALFSFLRFNLSNDKIFLGDGGSLFLGFILAVAGIQLIEANAAHVEGFQGYAVIGVVSIFLLPVLDALRVFYTRIQNGDSPFKADKTHLHHLILLLGLGHKKTTAIILLVKLTMISFALVIFSATSITIALIAASILYCLLTNILGLVKQIKDWEVKIIRFEKN